MLAAPETCPCFEHSLCDTLWVPREPPRNSDTQKGSLFSWGYRVVGACAAPIACEYPQTLVIQRPERGSRWGSWTASISLGSSVGGIRPASAGFVPHSAYVPGPATWLRFQVWRGKPQRPRWGNLRSRHRVCRVEPNVGTGCRPSLLKGGSRRIAFCALPREPTGVDS